MSVKRIYELHSRINKDGDNKLDEYRLYQALVYQFDINDMFLDCDRVDGRFKAYYINKQICTDTLVGDGMLFMDNKPVAIFRWMARKSPIVLYFFDRELYNACRMLLLDLLEDEMVNFVEDSDIDIMEDTFKIDFTGSILKDQIIVYNGNDYKLHEEIQVSGEFQKFMEIKSISTGEIITVDIDDVRIKSELL